MKKSFNGKVRVETGLVELAKSRFGGIPVRFLMRTATPPKADPPLAERAVPTTISFLDFLRREVEVDIVKIPDTKVEKNQR